MEKEPLYRLVTITPEFKSELLEDKEIYLVKGPYQSGLYEKTGWKIKRDTVLYSKILLPLTEEKKVSKKPLSDDTIKEYFNAYRRRKNVNDDLSLYEEDFKAAVLDIFKKFVPSLPVNREVSDCEIKKEVQSYLYTYGEPISHDEKFVIHVARYFAKWMRDKLKGGDNG